MMPTLLLGLATAAASLQSTPTPADQDPEASPAGRESYLGREVALTMHWRGAPWLLRATREDEENGERLRAWLDVRSGESVCDLGCGNGYHTLPLAAAVGPEGRVFAVDLQPEMLDLLAERGDGLGLTNLVPVEATVDDPRLPEDSVDTVLMVDVYHELSHPVRVLGHVRRALRKGGRVVLVEFRSEDRGVPIKLRHKMSKAQVVREMAANGFRLADETDALPWQHAMAFEAAPADPRLEARELARGFVRAASGSDARVLLPYLAPMVTRAGADGEDEDVPAAVLARSVADAMRAGQPPVAPGTRVELRGAADGHLTAALVQPEAPPMELLLGRDDEGRWQVEGWWDRAPRGRSFMAMHTGLGRLDPSETAALLDELGYDGVGCGLGDAAALRSALEPLGLDVLSSYATLDLTGDQDAQLGRIEAEMAALAGGFGEIWLAIRAGDGAVEDEVLRRTAERAVARLLEQERRTGVGLALYPHTGFWLATTEEAVTLAKSAPPGAGVCFNLCHYLRRDAEPELGPLLRAAAPHLSAVTVNGAEIDGADWGQLIQPLDAGDHDLRGLLEALDEVGFGGSFGLQGYGVRLPPEVHLARSMAAWREALRQR